MSCVLDTEPNAASAVIQAYQGGILAIEKAPYLHPREVNAVLSYGNWLLLIITRYTK